MEASAPPAAEVPDSRTFRGIVGKCFRPCLKMSGMPGNESFFANQGKFSRAD